MEFLDLMTDDLCKVVSFLIYYHNLLNSHFWDQACIYCKNTNTLKRNDKMGFRWKI